MKTLSKIFYIYSDASVAVLMFAGFIIELVCSFFVPAAVLYLTIPATVFFGIVAVSMARGVYIDAKKSSII
jgi:hypothetical protein